jgi:predicted transcriptional regulator
MATDPPTAPAWATVGAFLRSTDIRPEHQVYPVVGPDGAVTGVLSAAAIRAMAPHLLDGTPVEALAYPLERITIVHADEQLLTALQKVEGGDVHIGLAVDPDGRIVGTIDPRVVDHLVAQRKRAATEQRVGAH